MKTDIIKVSTGTNRIGEMLELADKVAVFEGLTGKSALHLRLLTEEMAGLMRSITGENEGTFWIEQENGEYQLHLRVQTILNSERKERLLDASSSGKNESAKGLMGRLRDFFDWGSYEEFESYTSPLLLPDMLEHSSSPMLDLEWSMSQYENSLYARVQKKDPDAAKAWDELEKSVVKHVADEIRVSIRGGVVEMTIFKKLG